MIKDVLYLRSIKFKSCTNVSLMIKLFVKIVVRFMSSVKLNDETYN